MDTLFPSLDGCSAEFSPDDIYRYTLTRQWSDGPCVAFLMFNPSTATATKEDPTIRKCIGFSRRWGYGRLIVLNLFSVRNKDPKAVGKMGLDAIGPLNDYWISESLKECREIICAWGCGEHFKTSKYTGIKNLDFRPIALIDNLRAAFPYMPIQCLGYREDGHPRHPLMLSYATPREAFRWRNQVLTPEIK